MRLILISRDTGYRSYECGSVQLITSSETIQKMNGKKEKYNHTKNNASAWPHPLAETKVKSLIHLYKKIMSIVLFLFLFK